MGSNRPPDFPDSLVDTLLTPGPGVPSSRAALRRRLMAAVQGLDEQRINELAEALKERVVQNLWADISLALRAADLILDLAKLTGNDRHRALGLRAKAQALMIGLGEHRKALRLYEQALAIHRQHGDRLGQAMVYLTSIWAMANTGKFRQAVEAGEWSRQVFQEYQQWRSFATLQNNLAAIYNRSYEFQRALHCTEEASQVYRQLGEEGSLFLANNEVNRAMALCSLGRFPESLKASQEALELAQAHDQKIVIARARHNLAITCYLMGRYNQALELLIEATQAHTEAGQPHEAALCDLTAAACLLDLNRVEAVLEKCEKLLPLFRRLEMRLEEAEAAHYQAVAFLRMGRAGEAVSALKTVRELFEAETLPHWAAYTSLEVAQACLQDKQPDQALEIARQSAAELLALRLPYETFQARLVEANALLDLGRREEARSLLETAAGSGDGGFDTAASADAAALAISSAKADEDWPALAFQLHLLAGRELLMDEQKQAALEQFKRSAEALERLRSQVMLEYRASFLSERESVYQEIVALYLEQGQPDLSLEYAERARSRAMLELLSGRADLSLQARQPADEPLLEKIRQLQSERQQYVRRLDTLSLDIATRVEEERNQLKGRVLRLEREITTLWHNLMIRNAAYAQDAALWQVVPDGLELHVDPGSLLLEYFSLENQLVLFLVHPGQEDGATGSGGATGSSGATGSGAPRVEAIRLPVELSQVERMVTMLQLNLSAVPVSPPQVSASLEANARRLLKQLYDALLAPAAEAIAGYERLVIVPHGSLHYLPFHALHDGQGYLLETHTVRYLPTAALLNHRPEGPAVGGGMLAVGHSFQGRLPCTLEEARGIAGLWGAEPLLEQEATLARLREAFPGYRLIHLACHGEFRPDNPLFSGLALEEGWLTTLEIFNLRLKASLVTLSACQSGQGVIGGGDELAGLMRALLSAGAESLVLSQWAVSDQSTARLMEAFYRALAQGEEKAAALRQAQLDLLRGEKAEYRHPYYWAPFFLVGDGGRL